MWSLPNIVQLNAHAAANAAKLKRQARSKRKPTCEHFDCKSPATISHLVHDIFSNEPKAVIHLCEDHDGFSGSPMEGYFTCDHCQRVMAENCTWEMYFTTLGDETVCLKCAAEALFGDDENWIDPGAVKEVVLEPEGLLLFDPQTGVLNVARCKHVLGVKQPLPKGIQFFDNSEFDSMDGHQISGDNLMDVIRRLPPGEKFCVVLDAAYQFAVSIGIYTRAGASAQQEAA